jgi:hypothetical protein
MTKELADLNKKLQTVSYWDWDDLEAYFCNYMDIPKECFGDYHKVVGGDFKSFWHVWLSLVQDDVSNYSYRNYWVDVIAPAKDCSSYNHVMKPILEEYGEWALKLVEALRSLVPIVGENGLFIVYYCW